MGLKKYLETIRIRLLGPPEDPKRSGSTMSSNAPEPDPDEPKSDFMANPRQVGFSVEIDSDDGPRHRRPDGDGWKWRNGEWYRTIKCGQGAEMLEDDEPPRRGRKYRVNNPLV